MKPAGKIQAAFTLIELLVVIAIIALLMGIMLPVLGRAREQGRIVVCRSNLRQYHIVNRMYLDDNDGRFPRTVHWLYDKQPSGYCMWHDKANNFENHPEYGGLLWPYMRDKRMHLCPTFNLVARNKGCWWSRHNSNIPIEPQYSYSMNAFLGGDGQGMVPIETQVRNAAEVFLFSEENSWEIPGMTGCGINDNNLRIGIPDDLVDGFGTFHAAPGGDVNKGSANIVFVDGHVGVINAADQYDGGNFKLAWPRSWDEVP
jgi:prepilin-type N-terminal cleavage/methylation domain-containing protein/prepilin-type processing-associated H-X9-DG protein